MLCVLRIFLFTLFEYSPLSRYWSGWYSRDNWVYWSLICEGCNISPVSEADAFSQPESDQMPEVIFCALQIGFLVSRQKKVTECWKAHRHKRLALRVLPGHWYKKVCWVTNHQAPGRLSGGLEQKECCVFLPPDCIGQPDCRPILRSTDSPAHQCRNHQARRHLRFWWTRAGFAARGNRST